MGLATSLPTAIHMHSSLVLSSALFKQNVSKVIQACKPKGAGMYLKIIKINSPSLPRSQSQTCTSKEARAQQHILVSRQSLKRLTGHDHCILAMIKAYQLTPFMVVGWPLVPKNCPLTTEIGTCIAEDMSGQHAQSMAASPLRRSLSCIHM